LADNSNILFLLVNYFNEVEVCSFIKEQLHPVSNNFTEVLIIDNGSKDPVLLENIAKEYSRVNLIKASYNTGYFGAAYLGLTNYLNQHKVYPKAVIICNTDISLSPDFLIQLQQKLTTGNFDILGPSIHSDFLNYYQNPYIINRIKTNKLKFLHFISSNYFLYSLFTFYHVVKTKIKPGNGTQLTKATTPYAIHGSFMIFAKSFFEKGGTINYPSVLFGEEVFIAEQALQLKLNMIYEPSLQVEHHEHATTGIFKSRQTVAYLHQSYTYLLKTFFKP
jgi:GT2 family glycosyltransferase